MKTMTSFMLGVILTLTCHVLLGEDDEYTLRGRKAAQAFLASPEEKTANNDDLDFYPLLDEFFNSGADTATKEYRLRCHLYYQGLLIKYMISKEALKEKAPKDGVAIMRCYDQEPLPDGLPDWEASKAKKPSFESLLDLFFKCGEKTITIDFRTGCHESWETMKTMSEIYDLIMAQSDASKQEKIFSQIQKWKTLDERRNKRDTVVLTGGSWSSIFISLEEIERNEKLSAYLKNMELMDEIEYFQVRCLGKKLFMQNGEIDFLFPKDSFMPEHHEPVAIIIPATVKKQIIGKDVWHVAVFIPDDLIPHEMKHGGCLVVWKNGKHVASFTWEKDIRISVVEFSGQQKVRISGCKIVDYDKDGDAVSMEFDFTEPNDRELDVNYGLADYMENPSFNVDFEGGEEEEDNE